MLRNDFDFSKLNDVYNKLNKSAADLNEMTASSLLQILNTLSDDECITLFGDPLLTDHFSNFKNDKEFSGATSLVHLVTIAAKTGREKLVIALLDKSNYAKKSVMPLYTAVDAGHLNVARLLLQSASKGRRKQSSLVDAVVSETNRTPLQLAVEKNDLEMVKLLLQWGVDPDAGSAMKALHLVQDDYIGLAIAAELLNAKSNINAIASSMTPLFYALTKKKFHYASYLLRSGANVHAENTIKGAVHASTVFQYILHMVGEDKFDRKWLKVAIERGGQLPAYFPNGSAPLQESIKHRDHETIALLLQHGADPDAVMNQSDNKHNALRQVALKGMVNSVYEMLVYHANPANCSFYDSEYYDSLSHPKPATNTDILNAQYIVETFHRFKRVESKCPKVYEAINQLKDVLIGDDRPMLYAMMMALVQIETFLVGYNPSDPDRQHQKYVLQTDVLQKFYDEIKSSDKLTAFDIKDKISKFKNSAQKLMNKIKKDHDIRGRLTFLGTQSRLAEAISNGTHTLEKLPLYKR